MHNNAEQLPNVTSMDKLQFSFAGQHVHVFNACHKPDGQEVDPKCGTNKRCNKTMFTVIRVGISIFVADFTLLKRVFTLLKQHQV